MNIRVSKDSWKVGIAKTPVILPNAPYPFVVRRVEGRIHMFINDKQIDMNTTNAHDMGIALGITQLAPDEMSILTINGERVDLYDPLAYKLSAALLRKADDADDWQINRKRKLQ